MEFRMVYHGLLLTETNKGRLANARATHKHEIRKKFHPQLKRLWEIHPYLKQGRETREQKYHGQYPTMALGAPRNSNTIPELSKKFCRFGYNFVPLVTRELGLNCSLDVLFLREDVPGSVFSAGDIDNRLKTLFDGLIVPHDVSQLGDHSAPSEGEDPFFCLLEDDSLINKVSVETDTLLEPVSDPPNSSDARVIVTVRINPYRFRPDTLGFL